MPSVAIVSMHDRGRLVLTKFALVLFLLGMPVAQTQRYFWPVINWSMYHIRFFNYPANTTTDAIELVAITNLGALRRVDPSALVSVGRETVSKRMINCALGRGRDHPKLHQRCREHLVEMVKRTLPGDYIQTLEVWQVVWDVNLVASPPLTRDAPRERSLLASFVLDGEGAEGQAQ